MVKQYSNIVQRPYPDPAWRFYTAFLFFKNAVVLQGIEARRRQGVASSGMAVKLLELGPLLVEISSTHLAEAQVLNSRQLPTGSTVGDDIQAMVPPRAVVRLRPAQIPPCASISNHLTFRLSVCVFYFLYVLITGLVI